MQTKVYFVNFKTKTVEKVAIISEESTAVLTLKTPKAVERRKVA